ncbi:MAG: FecR domain-containing protein [Acidobacteria bacterium]|nr:FecR domain-containing protein [Acidobacteriota bacterium]MBI3422982.1 FecR domain-containing protein [Acidobacteriota bacterium]
MFSKHVGKKLSAYHHGELVAAKRQRIAAHLALCARCQAEYEQVAFGAQMVAQMAGQPEQIKAPARLWDDLNAQLPRELEAESTRLAEAARQRGPIPPRLKFALAAACALFLLVAGTVSWRLYRKATAPAWEVETLAGLPRIGQQLIQKAGKLRVGEWLETDQTASARINVGAIGQVEIEPNSQVQLVTARATEHRLTLQRGKLTAIITAPPRVFFVNTPSATAVDLGCAYTLEVAENGAGTLRVIAGWVAYEAHGIESFVPEEAMCITRPVFGPGTPYYEDASAALQAAVARFDIAPPGERNAALTAVLHEARPRDGLTLWHLLARTNTDERKQVFARFATLIPPPQEVTLEGIQRGDHTMLDAWWEKLELGSPSWWRMWKAPLPSMK